MATRSRKPWLSPSQLAARYSDHETGTLLRPAGFKPEQEDWIAAQLERQPDHHYVSEPEPHDFDYAAHYQMTGRTVRRQSYRRNAR